MENVHKYMTFFIKLFVKLYRYIVPKNPYKLILYIIEKFIAKSHVLVYTHI